MLIPSAKAPRVVTEAMVKTMEKGSVLVDISIDQGGCFETSKPTTWAEPTYDVHGVTHFCRHQHARRGAADLHPGDLGGDPAVRAAPCRRRSIGAIMRRCESGINVEGGKLVHPALQGMLNCKVFMLALIT